MLIGSYLVIIAFVFWFKKPSFNKLALALCSVVLFQGIYFGSRWKNQQEQELIIFNSNKNTIIAERNGDLVTVYSSKSIQKEIEKNSTLKTYLVAHFSEVGVIKTVPNLVYSNHSKILILDSLGVYPKQIHPDILLITQSPKINLERFLLAKKPKIIVADGSNYKSYVALWKATCEKEKIPFHATGEKGFYRLN
jgi:competence protein ComEC